MSFLTKSSKTSVSGNKKQKLSLPFPLLIPVSCIVLGILSTKIISDFNIISLTTAFLFICFLFFHKHLRKSQLSYLSLMLLIVCISNLYTEIRNRQEWNTLSQILNTKKSFVANIEGIIDSEPNSFDKISYYTLNILSLNNKTVKGKLRIKVRTDSLQIGDLISYKGRVEKYEYSNPFENQWLRAMELKGIYAQSITLSKINKQIYPFVLNKLSLKQRLILVSKRFFFMLKSFVNRKIETKFPEYPSLIKAILMGEMNEFVFLDENNPLNSYLHYQKAGILHLLAVSGLHVSLIYFCIFTLLSSINRNFARCISIVLLIVFMGICQFAPSVIRAGIMIIIILLSKIMERRQSFWQIIAVSILIILIIDPNQIYDIGLLLSLNAIIAVYFSDYILTKTLKNELIKKIVFTPFSTLLITIFTLPIMFYFFSQINLNGLVSNVIMIPVFSIIMYAILLLLVIPKNLIAFTLIKKSLDFLIYLFEKSLEMFTNLPFIINFSINEAQFICLCLFLIIFTLFFFFKEKVLKISCLSALALVIICFFSYHSKPDNYSKIIFYNTGTSDAFLIHTSFDENIVIDTGDNPNSKAQIEKSLIPYCLKNQINKLDYVIITHAHKDHIGGLKALSEKLAIDNLLITDDMLSDTLFNQINKHLVVKRYLIIQDTLTLQFKGSKLVILHPDKEYIPMNLNNASIVVKWSQNDYDLLFCGDIDSTVENYLMKKYPEFLNCEIIKIPHHGSKYGSSEPFLEIVNPQFAVISTAKVNRFNFPHPRVIKTLQSKKICYFITGIDGAVTLIIKDDHAEIDSFKSHRKYFLKNE